jgi:hypothetical protein
MRFEATIEKGGRRHMLEIPFDVKAEWGKARAGGATINDHTFRPRLPFTAVAIYLG